MAKFELKICGLKDASFLANNWADKIVSLVDVDGPRPVFGDSDTHHLEVFDDVDREMFGYTPPRIEQIDNILKFTANFQDGEKILVHCHAGRCRSTAIALLALVQHGMSEEEAMQEILKQRPKAWPNMLIVKLGDALLGKGGDIVNFMIEWRNHYLVERDKLK